MDALKDTSNSVRLDAAPANQTQFYLEVQGMPSDSFSVLEFEGSEHGISRDYQFEVHVQVDHQLEPQALIGKGGTLTLVWDAQPVYVHGVVTDLIQVGNSVDGEEYIVVINSPLSVLKRNVQNRVFLGKDVQTIIEDVLIGAGMDSAAFEFKLSQSYPAREYTVQYDESDFNFVSRLMIHFGLFYTFGQTDQLAKLKISDTIGDLPVLNGTGELLYQEHTGQTREVETVFALRRRASLLTDAVQLKDYNYRTPEASLDAAGKREAALTGSGTDYRYGQNYKTLDEGELIARVRQQTLDWRRETFVAESDCRGVVPGVKFTLSGYPNDELNGDYRVVEVEHQADQRGAFPRGKAPKGMTYRNKMLLIREGVAYRTPLDGSVTIPRVHGTFSATVESTGGEYAYLDEQGRYRVRLPFDLADTQPGEASHPVRLMQAYTGSDYGMHFPLHAGTEVAISCINGDLDRPMLIGAVSNPDTPSPVTSANNTQNILRTWGGNELFMEDRKGEEKTELFTRDRKNILTLNAKDDNHTVRLATEEGKMEQYAAKTMLLESGDSQTVRSGNDHIVTVENAQRLMTKNKEIEMQAATDIRMKAGDNVLLQAETQNIEMEAGKDMIVDVKNNMSVEVRNEDMEMLITSGNMGIEAAKSITVKGNGGGTIHVGQAGGSLEVSTGGDLTVTGGTVTINGSSINIKGQSISNN